MEKNQPLTPCCNEPFMAVKDFSTAEGQLGLYSHAICKKCNKKYKLNLQECHNDVDSKNPHLPFDGKSM